MATTRRDPPKGNRTITPGVNRKNNKNTITAMIG
jgi:hypothetical protein